MVGESAGQQSFEVGITILVASKTADEANSGQDNLIGSTSIYTDEYCNKLDNPQIMEDLFGPIYRVFHYWIFKYKLLSFFSAKSNFSIDELTTMYHFPDVTYNRSPIIKWLEYKKVAPPHNLKSPREPLMMTDYVRTKDGYIEAKDGTKLQADSNGNLLRTEQNMFLTSKDEEIAVHKK